jgi:hypothetical protein
MFRNEDPAGVHWVIATGLLVLKVEGIEKESSKELTPCTDPSFTRRLRQSLQAPWGRACAGTSVIKPTDEKSTSGVI